MGRRRKDQQASQDVIEVLGAEVVDAAADMLSEMEAEVLVGSVEEQEGAPAVESVIRAEYHEERPATISTKWMVLEDQTVSLFGHMTLLPAGTVISAASYGPAGIKRIMEQGVQLAPLD